MMEEQPFKQSAAHGYLEQQDDGTVYETFEWNREQSLQEDGDISLGAKDGSKLENLDQHTLQELKPPPSHSLSPHLVQVDNASEIQNEEHFSDSLSNTWENAGFPLYLAEQHRQLPLPLRELMESEALEILTKALKSYRSKIGENHNLTKELHLRVKYLQRRKRLVWTPQ